MADPGSVVESLPDRPLLLEEAETLAETGPIHPGSVMQSAGGPLVFTLIVTGEETLYGLGYDVDDGAWTVVTTKAADEAEAGYAEIGSELKAWGEETYQDADHVEQEVSLETDPADEPDLPGEPVAEEDRS